MVMYELTDRGRALLAAVPTASGERVSAPVELPLVAPAAPRDRSPRSHPSATASSRSRVKFLSWLSLGAMSVEGIVALVAGVMAGSIALVGFGLDSAIEGFASVIIIWRFTGSRVMSQTAEHRAQKLVAIQFFLLAPYVAVESVRALVGGEHAEVSVLGMALAVWSLITMPLLGIAKQRIAEQIGSAATKGEGRQNVLCAYLAGALLVGLAGQRDRRRLVARPGRRPADRRRRRQGRRRGVARRRLLRRLAARRLRDRLPGRLLRVTD